MILKLQYFIYETDHCFKNPISEDKFNPIYSDYYSDYIIITYTIIKMFKLILFSVKL